MLFVLILDNIGKVFLYFDLHGHGKLNLKFVYGRAEKCVGNNKICPNKLRISEAEIAEKKIEPRVLEKKVCLFADTFTQVSNCYCK